jgi:orotate phosphoribosyltransferase
VKLIYEPGDSVRVKATGNLETVVVAPEATITRPAICTQQGGMYTTDELEPASAPKLLLDLLSKQVIRGKFTLASGQQSTWYIDGRRVVLSAKGAPTLAMEILRRLHGRSDVVHAIGGPIIGADPIVGACMALAPAWARADLVGFLVRDRAKGHGLGRLIEGLLEPGMTAALVDDVATSGRSLVRAARAVREFGGSVWGAFCRLDRQAGAAEALAEEGVPFYPLFTAADLGIIEEEVDGQG